MTEAFEILENKVEIDELESLRTYVKELPRSGDVDELKNYVIECIENFHNDNETFRSDFNN